MMKTLTIEKIAEWQTPLDIKPVPAFEIRITTERSSVGYMLRTESKAEALDCALKGCLEKGWEVRSEQIEWDEDGDGFFREGNSPSIFDAFVSLPYGDETDDDGFDVSMDDPSEKSDFAECLEVADGFGDLVATAAFLKGHKISKK